MNAFGPPPVISTDTTEFPHPATPKWARWIVVTLIWLGRGANALAACCTLSGFAQWATIAKLVSLAAGIGTAAVTHYSVRRVPGTNLCEVKCHGRQPMFHGPL
jgi:hypothetical protein